MQIFSIILIATVVFVFLIRKSVRNARKRKMSTWQVGDIIILTTGEGILRGWTLDFIYISKQDSPKTTKKLKINRLEYNKSAYWRNNFDECQKTMGVEPQFNRDAVASMASSNGRRNGSKIIDGKSIELLTEIECQIYLKECLKDEDYETAELIKKQLEKYR
jgi:hypothetical protein